MQTPLVSDPTGGAMTWRTKIVLSSWTHAGKTVAATPSSGKAASTFPQTRFINSLP